MFDLSYLDKNKLRSVHNIKNSEFYQFVGNDLIARLEPLDKTYNKILFINNSPSDSTNLECFKKSFSHDGEIEVVTPETLAFAEKKSIDLIYFPFGLHWISNIQEFLFTIYSILKEDGIFICNFAGAGSLNNLRKTIFLAEEQAGSAHFPHVIPFIKFDDVAELLKHAGFNENITDFENLTLDYRSPIDLMKALNKYGESNALVNRTHYSLTRQVYKILTSQNNSVTSNFFDQVNLITLISSPTKNSIKLKSAYFFK